MNSKTQTLKMLLGNHRRRMEAGGDELSSLQGLHNAIEMFVSLDNLNPFDHMLLAAIDRLGAEAYTPGIRDAVAEAAGREPPQGRVHQALLRLRQIGYVRDHGSATDTHGDGMPKSVWRRVEPQT